MEKARSARSPVAMEAARGGECDGGGGDGVSRARRRTGTEGEVEAAKGGRRKRKAHLSARGERLVVLPAEPAEEEPRGWQHCTYRFF
jgi:hypothetical protein